MNSRNDCFYSKHTKIGHSANLYLLASATAGARQTNLDKLAQEGARLEQFYAQPMCTPSRAALMTGRYPFRYGLQTAVIPSASKYGLSTDEWLLPQALKEVGSKPPLSASGIWDTEIASTGRASAGSTINTDRCSERSTILLIRRTGKPIGIGTTNSSRNNATRLSCSATMQ